MSGAGLKIRRGHRKDFAAAMALLAGGGIATPAADRSSLRRFRRIAADLGADLYVAELEGQLVGLVHVTYARQLASGQCARIEALTVAAPSGAASTEQALLDFAVARARKRACATLCCGPGALPAANPALLANAGFVACGSEYCVRLQTGS